MQRKRGAKADECSWSSRGSEAHVGGTVQGDTDEGHPKLRPCGLSMKMMIDEDESVEGDAREEKKRREESRDLDRLPVSRKVGRTYGEPRTGTTLQLSLRETVADLATPLDRCDLSQIDELYGYKLTCHSNGFLVLL